MLVNHHLVRAGAIALALTAAGCITLEREQIEPSEGIIVLRAGRELKGAAESAVVTKAAKTVEAVPLTSDLVRRVAEETEGAIVSIYARTATPARVHLLPIRLPGLGLPVRLPGKGLGSGFLIHKSGLLITNDHVIRNAREIRALLSDGSDHEVDVLARDRVFDLALLKLRGTSGNHPVLKMGDADAIAGGDFVIAAGNPLGLGRSVTFGIVSQTERNLTGVQAEDVAHIDFIQLDAAINPGSSGGPLITLTGAWVGVNTAGILGAQNVGFAVPSSQVKAFLDRVRKGDTSSRPVPKRED